MTTTTELRELDAWIAENVMGDAKGQTEFRCYTTDPAAAMMVLEKCILHFDLGTGDVEIGRRCRTVEREWFVVNTRIGKWAYAETLPLAICLFAKELFK